MSTATNRVLLAFKNWEERKKEMEPLLKANQAHELVLTKLQLAHLRQAGQRLNISARADERPFMLLLASHIDKLEKQLYPNWLVRTASRFKYHFIDGPLYLKQQAHQRNANMTNLKLQLKDLGLAAIAGKLEEHLDPDLRRVTLPLNCQLTETKQLGFTLYFKKDAQENFQLESFDGALRQQGEIQQAHHFQLSDWPGLTTNQALSLLEGRALRQTFTDAAGQEQQRWVEIGKYGVQHYEPKLDFDLTKALAQLPAVTGNKPELISQLENGQAAAAHWKVDRHYQRIYIQADPANRSLKIFDEKNKAVTPEKLNQNARQQNGIAPSMNQTVQKNRKSVRNGNRL
jgi:hypothetical protein